MVVVVVHLVLSAVGYLAVSCETCITVDGTVAGWLGDAFPVTTKDVADSTKAALEDLSVWV